MSPLGNITLVQEGGEIFGLKILHGYAHPCLSTSTPLKISNNFGAY
jgi:hypothetical protein